MSARKVGMDKFPNFMSGRLTLSAANTFTTQQIFTPIPRLKTTGNKATVMELLWMELVPTVTDFVASGDNLSFGVQIGAVPTAVATPDDPRSIWTYITEFGALTSGGNLQVYPARADFQSQDGHGYLLASDAFHITGLSTGQAAAVSYNWRIYYRFVEISVAEFVGLVQSTQQS